MKPRHIAVVGLGFGDEGKGNITDFLCRRHGMDAVVRFNGGAQAAHNVVTDNGQHHTFAQWGSGTLAGVPTYLSEFMIIEPFSMINEALHLKEIGVNDPWAMLHIDGGALVATPYHRAVGRARELVRGAKRHGSVGMGIGEAVSHSLDRNQLFSVVRFRDLRGDEFKLVDKLGAQRYWAQEELAEFGSAADVADVLQHLPDPETVAQAYKQVARKVTRLHPEDWNHILSKRCLFEGAQGVLLDENYGFHPYTTWSTTTFANVRAFAVDGDVFRLGVVRSYTTRHGPGPLPTEDHDLAELLAEPHNETGKWQGGFRIGHFDAVAHRYAVKVCGGIDGVAVTHMERARVPEICSAYYLPEEGISVTEISPGADLVEQAKLTDRVMRVKPVLERFRENVRRHIADELGVPVVLASSGTNYMDKWLDIERGFK